MDDLQALLAQFQPTQADRDSARAQALLTMGLGLLGARRGQEFERLGRAGLLGQQAYLGTLHDSVAQRGQQLTQAANLQKLMKDMQFTQMGMDMVNGGGSPAPSAGAVPNGAVPSGAPSGGLPSFANPRTELGFALAGKKDVADVLHRQYQVTQGPGGTLIRNGAIVGQVIPNAGMVLDGKFQSLPKEATDALINFEGGKAGAVKAAEFPYTITEATGPDGPIKGYAAKMFGPPPVPGAQPNTGAIPPGTTFNFQNAPANEVAAALRDAASGGANPTGIVQGPNPLAMKAAESAIETQAAQNTEIAKTQGKEYTDIVTAERQAPNNIGRLDLMKKYLSNVGTGKAAPTVLSLKAYASYFAPELAKSFTKDVPFAQAASALSNELALQLRNPSQGGGMPGSLSNSDRDFLASMTANVANDPRSIPLMLDARIAIEKRNQEVGKMARQYYGQHGKIDEGFYQQVQDYATAHPVFSNMALPGAPSGLPAGWKIERVQ